MNDALGRCLKCYALLVWLQALLPAARAEDAPARPPIANRDRLQFTSFRAAPDPSTGDTVIVVEIKFVNRGNAIHRLRLGEKFDRFTVRAFRVRPREHANEESDFIAEVDLRIDPGGAMVRLPMNKTYEIANPGE